MDGPLGPALQPKWLCSNPFYETFLFKGGSENNLFEEIVADHGV